MWMRDANDRLSGWWFTIALVFLLSLVVALLATHVSHNLPRLAQVVDALKGDQRWVSGT